MAAVSVLPFLGFVGVLLAYSGSSVPKGRLLLPARSVQKITLPPGVAALATPDPLLNTYRLGRDVRPARPLKVPSHAVRTIRVPAGGAVFETSIGALDGPVAIRISREGGEVLAETIAPAGKWTDIRLALNPSMAGTIALVEQVTSAGGVYALAADASLSPLERDGRPDLFVITLDTVRRDALSPFGAPASATPVIGRFASDATRFEQAVSVTSWTMPAHAALLTGRFPSLDLGFSSFLKPSELTLAELLAAEGYETHGMSGGPYTDSDFGFQQGFGSFVDSSDWKNAERITNQAIEWVDRGTGAPLFLFLNYFDAHEPFTDTTAAEYAALESGAAPLEPAVLARFRNGYATDVRRIDSQLGRLFDEIRSRRSWRDAVIVLVADHGELLGERGHIGHALSLDEELIHIPLIVKAAAQAPLPVSSYREQFEIDDVFTLALELTGVSVSPERAVKRKIEAGEPVRLLTFSQVRHDPTPALLKLPRWRSAVQHAVRTDTTKVVRDLEGRVSTYRIGKANGEVLVPNTELTARLEGELKRFEGAVEGRLRSAPPLVLRQDLIDRLRSLGYIR